MPEQIHMSGGDHNQGEGREDGPFTFADEVTLRVIEFGMPLEPWQMRLIQRAYPVTRGEVSS